MIIASNNVPRPHFCVSPAGPFTLYFYVHCNFESLQWVGMVGEIGAGNTTYFIPLPPFTSNIYDKWCDSWLIDWLIVCSLTSTELCFSNIIDKTCNKQLEWVCRQICEKKRWGVVREILPGRIRQAMTTGLYLYIYLYIYITVTNWVSFIIENSKQEATANPLKIIRGRFFFILLFDWNITILLK